MRNRDDAIRWLSNLGYVAFARDWAIGESIAITKRFVEVADGLQRAEPTLIYIYPIDAGKWAVVQPITPSDDIHCANLEAAVSQAINLLETYP